MSGFIEVVDKNKRRRLLNIKHIEEVMENITKGGCCIYLAFNTPNAIEQDYIEVSETYNSIVGKICEATVLNNYVKIGNY